MFTPAAEARRRGRRRPRPESCPARLPAAATCRADAPARSAALERPARPALPQTTRPGSLPVRHLIVLDRGGEALNVIRGLVGRDHGVELLGTQDPAEALSTAQLVARPIAS